MVSVVSEDFMSCMKLTFGTPLRIISVSLRLLLSTDRQVIYRSSWKKTLFSDIYAQYSLGILCSFQSWVG